MSPHQAKDKQNAILTFIRQTIETQGYSPTIEEIKAGCGLSSKSVVAYHLSFLEARGHIEIIHDFPRGIKLPAGPVCASFDDHTPKPIDSGTALVL